LKEHSFQPGDKVIWLKDTGGGFFWPVLATVVAITAKRVTISADDPDETGAGIVTRSVTPSRLQPRVEQEPPRNHKKTVSRGKRQTKVAPGSVDSFEVRYPHITSWVEDGWIEIGRDDSSRSFVRALDCGGLAWEGSGSYASLDEALRALDAGIASWQKE
jgi:hypothetical protein